MKQITFIFCLFLISKSIAQSTAERSLESNRKTAFENSEFKYIQPKNVGPSIFNGRVTDIDVNPEDPTQFFVAYGSGGLWHTKNNGITMEPHFQHESVMTIGDIAVDWKTGVIYLGSGEQNSSRSSYAGNGVYKSKDWGKTWTHLGLDETHHISKVIIHPKNNNILWVAALGHLYTTNKQRGIYKSIDGGKSWKQTLYVDETTGASDLVIHPTNPNILYCAFWQKDRKAWHFTESGPNSGIYRSGDGGNTWTKISGSNSGFASGEALGRIGLDIVVKNKVEYLYAVIDNNNKRPTEPRTVAKGLTKESLKSMSAETFLKLKDSEVNDYLRQNRFPAKYDAKSVKSLIEDKKIVVSDIVTYNENANSALFDAPIIGAEVYVTTSQGKTWKKTHDGFLDGIYFTYGYYFGQIRVNPSNVNKIYIYGVPIVTSDDGGKTWKSLDAPNVHVDHHSLWINPKKPGHIINGNDGGINISYDDGKNWFKCINPEVGQFYSVNVDNNEPYNIYGGTQDNGVWMGPSTYENNTDWQSSGQYPYKELLGGDGMQVQIDNRDNATIYTGFQFGNYFKINQAKKERSMVTPRHELGGKPYRWNWNTPILLSPHNQDILYMGANFLLRSMDQGRSFKEISPDLTQGEKKGNVAFATITTLDESKLKFGLIYVGTDDGLIHVTKDGGNTWTKISSQLPQGYWVSRVHASSHKEGTVYVSLNGYRNDHFAPYIYKSTDYGATWENLSFALPNEPVNVIKEDPLYEDIVYVGTDHGLYISTNRGKTFKPFAADMPRVAVYDLVVQTKAKDLVIGTHGRSIYLTSLKNVYDQLQKSKENLIVFQTNTLRYTPNWGKKFNFYRDAMTPTFTFDAFSSSVGNGEIKIIYGKELTVYKENISLKKGFASYEYQISVLEDNAANYLKAIEDSEWHKKSGPLKKSENGKFYPIPGKYLIQISANGSTATREFEIK